MPNSTVCGDSGEIDNVTWSDNQGGEGSLSTFTGEGSGNSGTFWLRNHEGVGGIGLCLKRQIDMETLEDACIESGQ